MYNECLAEYLAETSWLMGHKMTGSAEYEVTREQFVTVIHSDTQTKPLNSAPVQWINPDLLFLFWSFEFVHIFLHFHCLRMKRGKSQQTGGRVGLTQNRSALSVVQCQNFVVLHLVHCCDCQETQGEQKEEYDQQSH